MKNPRSVHRGEILSETNDCNRLQFELVKQYIQEFELDNRVLRSEEFLIEKDGLELLAFGRIREYSGFSELCSLGVIKKERSKGLGKKLTKALIKKSLQPLYLVCIIPDYFKVFGFSICTTFPLGIQDKLNYCTTHLEVNEEYVVMKLD